MGFDVAADAYDRFMGRWSEPLAREFAAGLRAGDRVLDVGAGPGALTSVLVGRLGPAAVAAVDPSLPFVTALRARLPGVEVLRGHAERLPFPDDAFDAALAQLVVHFMTDPVAGLREMARVTRPGGQLGACVWDHAGGGPLAAFWRAVRDLDPGHPGESALAGTREGHLAELAAAAGWSDPRASRLSVERGFATFEEWWEPFLLGVGPAGDHVRRLPAASRAELERRCRALLPPAPFALAAGAWCVWAAAPEPSAMR